MNLIELQDQLRMMADPQLQQELRGGDPSTQALAMSEVMRRQRLRAGAQGNGKPKQSIYEQMLGQATAPPMPPGMNPGMLGKLGQPGPASPPTGLTGVLPQLPPQPGGQPLPQPPQPGLGQRFAQGGEVHGEDDDWNEEYSVPSNLVSEAGPGLSQYGDDASWLTGTPGLSQVFGPDTTAPPYAANPTIPAETRPLVSSPPPEPTPGLVAGAPSSPTAGLGIHFTGAPGPTTSNKAGEDLYGPMIDEEAKNRNVDPLLLRSIAAVETGFVPRRGQDGEYGVMQLMPDTAKQYGVNTADQRSIIHGGASKWLDSLKQANGDWDLATQLYNGNPKDPRTSDYLTKVKAEYERRGGKWPGAGGTQQQVSTDQLMKLFGVNTTNFPEQLDKLKTMMHSMGLDTPPPDIKPYEYHPSQLTSSADELRAAQAQANEMFPQDNSLNELRDRLEALRPQMGPRELTQGEKLILFGAGMKRPWDVIGGIANEYGGERKEEEAARERALKMYGLDSNLVQQQELQRQRQIDLTSRLAGLQSSHDVANWQAQNAADQRNLGLEYAHAVQMQQMPHQELAGMAQIEGLMQGLNRANTLNPQQILMAAAAGDPTAQVIANNLIKYQQEMRNRAAANTALTPWQEYEKKRNEMLDAERAQNAAETKATKEADRIRGQYNVWKTGFFGKTAPGNFNLKEQQFLKKLDPNRDLAKNPYSDDEIERLKMEEFLRHYSYPAWSMKNKDALGYIEAPKKNAPQQHIVIDRNAPIFGS